MSPGWSAASIPRRMSPIDTYVNNPKTFPTPVTAPIPVRSTLSTPFVYNPEILSRTNSAVTEPRTVVKREDSTPRAGPSNKGKKKVSPTPTLRPIFLDESFLHLDQAIFESGRTLGLSEPQVSWVKEVAENVTKVNIVKAYNVLGDKLYEHDNANESAIDELRYDNFIQEQRFDTIDGTLQAHYNWLTKLEGQEERVSEIIGNFGKRVDGIESRWDLLAPRYQKLRNQCAQMSQVISAQNENMEILQQNMKKIASRMISLEQQLLNKKDCTCSHQFAPSGPHPGFTTQGPPMPPVPPVTVFPAPVAPAPVPSTTFAVPLSGHTKLPDIGKPTAFTGKGQNFEEWLTKVINYFTYYSVSSDQQKIILSMSFLSGDALTFMNKYNLRTNAGEPLGTFQEFVQDLKVGYGERTPERTAQDKLDATCKKNFDSMQRFAEKFRSLAVQSGLSDKDLIYRISEQRPKDMRAAMATARIMPTYKEPDTWQEYLDHCLSIEASLKGERKNSTHDTSGTSAPKDSDAMDVSAVQKKTPEPMSKEQIEWMANGKCFKCGKHPYKKNEPCRNPTYKGFYALPTKKELRAIRTEETSTSTSPPPNSHDDLREQLRKMQERLDAAEKKTDSSSEKIHSVRFEEMESDFAATL
jgi:hypothetical protein